MNKYYLIVGIILVITSMCLHCIKNNSEITICSI